VVILVKKLLIFKGHQYWKFKATGHSEFDSNILFPGYPRLILKDYGIERVEGGFFAKFDQNSHSNCMFLFFGKVKNLHIEKIE
jgi:hypothetical protein